MHHPITSSRQFITCTCRSAVSYKSPYLGCYNDSMVTFSCPSASHVLRIDSVENGLTRNTSDTPFCAHPFPTLEHCLRPASQSVDAFIKECGALSACSRTLKTSLGEDVKSECGSDYDGGLAYVIVHYTCRESTYMELAKCISFPNHLFFCTFTICAMICDNKDYKVLHIFSSMRRSFDTCS